MVDDFGCLSYSGESGAELVTCSGIFAHVIPFDSLVPPYLAGTRLMWQFMQSHRKVQME